MRNNFGSPTRKSQMKRNGRSPQLFNFYSPQSHRYKLDKDQSSIDLFRRSSPKKKEVFKKKSNRRKIQALQLKNSNEVALLSKWSDRHTHDQIKQNQSQDSLFLSQRKKSVNQLTSDRKQRKLYPNLNQEMINSILSSKTPNTSETSKIKRILCNVGLNLLKLSKTSNQKNREISM